MEDPNSQTYEQANAQKLNLTATDPIHYNAEYSYRNSPYRFLHHQNGKIGNFKVRIIEGKNLKRRHWSVLGLGPMKHLGLSRACGEVSSFATMRLCFAPRLEGEEENDTLQSDRFSSSFMTGDDPNFAWEESESIASVVTASTSASASASISSNVNINSAKEQGMNTSISSKKSSKSYFSREYRSSIVQSNANPKWPTVQSTSNSSCFEMDLEKGGMPHDGMKIFLRIQMREEITAADSIVPVKGGSGNGILGGANINLTPLVLRGFGSDGSCDMDGEDVDVDVWDRWVDLLQPRTQSGDDYDEKKDHGDESSQVRLLISYHPVGFSPRRGDIVALESFARQQSATSSIRPILPPFAPMRVKDMRGEYLLCTFELFQGANNGHSSSNSKKGVTREGSLRLHRNAVFVIERTNVIDCAVDVAMKPADLVLSTPIGQEVTQTLSPYVESAGDVLMPAVLSAKLLVEAAKVGGSAFAVGMKSAATAVIENQGPEKRRRSRRIHSTDAE